MRYSFLAYFCLIAGAPLVASSAIAGDPLSPLLQVELPAKGGPRSAAEVAVTLRLRQHPSPDVMRRLRAAGARPKMLAGQRLAAVGSVVSMRVPKDRLAAIAALPEVVWIEPAVPPVRLTPLDKTRVMVGAPYVHPFPRNKGNLGEGVLVADHEDGFDPFHPDFFRPDGGLFAFEDTAADGRAGPGDHVDLDGDGVFESELRLLEGKRTDEYVGEYEYAQPGYQPDVDWLYVDINRDRRRSFGQAQGFTDQDAALGEPIFVGDDVNQDGEISGGERLVRLGTPKVRVAYVNGAVYRRGENLGSYPVGDASHGTGATGIVAMGWPELRRYTGLAPAAELALVAADDIVEGIAFAQGEGARVHLYEFNLPTEANDGSSNVEVAISQAAAAGSIHLAAAGNLAGADKLMQVALAPNEPLTVELSTDGLGVYDYAYAFSNLTWHGAAGLVDIAVISQLGERFDVGMGGVQTLSGFKIHAVRQETDHGNGWVLLFIEPASGTKLPEEVLSMELSSASAVPVVRGLLFDSHSGWGKGVSWQTHVTNSGTAVCPSTGDNVIAVTAYGGNHDFTTYNWGAQGERRAYSGMGPRIDGWPVVDISAPDDPFTAAPHTEGGHGAYQSFGGTSGALPHVAGATALLLAISPSLDQAKVETALKSSALKDAFTGQEPSEQYGHGKLRIDATILGAATPEGRPPTVRLETVTAPIPGDELTIRAVVSDPDGHADALLVSWDIDYDRVYEIPGASDREIKVPLPKEGLTVVAKAIDPTGRSARALLVVSGEPLDAGTGAEPEPDAAADAAADAPADTGAQDSSSVSGGAQRNENGDGCGCGVAGGSSGGGWGAGTLAALLALCALRNKRATA